MSFFENQKKQLRNLCQKHSEIDEVQIVSALLETSGQLQLMIDVGAHCGESLGCFVEKGWRVHGFEPDAQNFKILEEKWGAFPNVHLNRLAVAARDEKGVAFFPSLSNSYIGSLAPFDPSHSTQPDRVDVVTLDTYCREHAIPGADFLKIDTEGYDLFVLQGMPWERMHPEVILCEYENRKTEPLGYSVDDLALFLLGHGYRLLVSEWRPIVQYSGPFRWRRFKEWRPGLVDPAGNGNLIAIRNPALFNRLNSLCRSRALKKRVLDFLLRLYSRL